MSVDILTGVVELARPRINVEFPGKASSLAIEGACHREAVTKDRPLTISSSKTSPCAGCRWRQRWAAGVFRGEDFGGRPLASEAPRRYHPGLRSRDLLFTGIKARARSFDVRHFGIGIKDDIIKEGFFLAIREL